VRMPRCLRKSKGEVNKRIITFVDASLQAYGTFVWLQCSVMAVTSRLIAGLMVAPLKPITVPRLELMGDVLDLCNTSGAFRELSLVAWTDVVAVRR